MVGIFSVHCSLLPFMEEVNVYNSINFDAMAGSPFWLELSQRTAAVQTIKTFLCPSDPGTRANPWGRNSYRACVGLGTIERVGGRTFNLVNDGAFVPLDDGRARVLPLSSFMDGFSNTLAFSEKPVGSGEGGSFQPFRDWMSRDWDGVTLSPDQWIAACSQMVPREPWLDAGNSWMLPGAVHTHFYASAPPNTEIPDCGSTVLNHGVGIFASRSYHPGGVNAAMADGSVRRFTSTTSTGIWRGLGTRSGGELVSQ
jgi:prepilin-type processing-associated H-X9-DG protein